MSKDINNATFASLIDLAAEEMGDAALACSNDFFTSIKNLINNTSKPASTTTTSATVPTSASGVLESAQPAPSPANSTVTYPAARAIRWARGRMWVARGALDPQNGHDASSA
jgi:hypothetical protein